MDKFKILNPIFSGQTQEETGCDVLTISDEDNKLILWNDDHNTFDFVIDSLMEICQHTQEQAEQCSVLVHYKGKCTVKTGSMKKLLPMHNKLISKGLTSEIQ